MSKKPKIDHAKKDEALRKKDIARLEKQYAKVAGQASVFAAHDDEIRKQAIKKHDLIQKEIKKIEPKLQALLPGTDQALAQKYGALLKERRIYHDIILRERKPSGGKTPPVA